MIANNFRKYPEAMALQLVLKFGHALVWALPRPTTRVLRAIRVARGAAFKLAGRIAQPIKPTTPKWSTQAKRRARKLAQLVQKACRPLEFTQPTKKTDYAAYLERCRETLHRYAFNISVNA